MGIPGLSITCLPDLVREQVSSNTKVMLFHVGANDIGKVSSWEWRRSLEEAVYFLKASYPHIVVVWSDMLPRRAWRYLPGCVADKTRKRLQCMARRLVREERGRVCHHDPLLFRETLSEDGVHLSRVGLDMFKENIEKCLTELVMT